MFLAKILEHSQSKSELCLKKQSLKFWKRTGKIFVRNVFRWGSTPWSYQAWTNCAPMGALGRAKPLFFPIFRARIFCLLKKKKTLDLQVFSQIVKTMKKLQWIPNTLLNASVLVIFWKSLHTWWCQNCFTSGLGNI